MEKVNLQDVNQELDSASDEEVIADRINENQAEYDDEAVTSDEDAWYKTNEYR